MVGYALNPNHKDGKHKARVFRSALGIEAKDWKFLASQLKAGLGAATIIQKVRSEDYAVKSRVLVPVTGRNGVVKPVLSAWEVRPRQPPRLTTAYVYEPEVVTDELPPVLPPLVVLDELSGNELWLAIWEVASQAGMSAAGALIPTPMLVVAAETQGIGIRG